MEQGDLVGLYCSDVSGAFDRVSRPRLVSKLELLGLHPSLSAFLASWLEDRVSEVVVGGQCSLQETLCDSVFQGTVLGPPLWNCFYKDARRAATAFDFTETVFADDFNCFKHFKRSKISQALRAEIEMKGAQKEVHLWGKANQVIFDPCKESFHFLHRRLHSGTEFKLLGVVFDSKLLMHSAARNVATEAGWRLQQLLKSRCFFTTPELMHLYKAQVLSYVESSTPAIYHASPSVLEPVDRVQRRLLRELGMSEVEALLNFRLAPLPSRRDMAMLGALHKVTLGLAPPQLAAFFPRAAGRTTGTGGLCTTNSCTRNVPSTLLILCAVHCSAWCICITGYRSELSASSVSKASSAACRKPSRSTPLPRLRRMIGRGCIRLGGED